VQPSFWHERWITGQIGFHQLAVDRQLSRHWNKVNISEGTVFVPLCGKSLDLAWLRDRGIQVIGVELSTVAVESLFLEQGILARRTPDEILERFESHGLRVLRGDIFNLSSESLGSVTAVYERASLIALPPQARVHYVEHLTTLTQPGTKTLLLTVEYDQHQTNGPPFSVSRAEVQELYGRHHAIELLERRDILADEPRLRSRGVIELHENTFLLTRQ
jgi:thiopurine S-methyltransferase